MKKTAFVTCVQLGLSCIEEIYNIGGELDLIITLEDRLDKQKSGRVYLDEIAHKNNVPLLKIENINDDVVKEKLKELDIDWLFIIGWSQIAKRELLHTPKLGCIGMHPTLLPEGRGRAAIPWAIIKGLDKTGVTLFELDEGVDTGRVIDQLFVEITDVTNATGLYKEIDRLHVELINKNWGNIIKNQMNLVTQDESRVTIWRGRKPKDGEIFNSMSMDEADKLIRATTKPYPGAFYKNNGKIIRIWEAKKNNISGDIKLKDGYIQLINYTEEDCVE